jgi:hypothetical protein
MSIRPRSGWLLGLHFLYHQNDMHDTNSTSYTQYSFQSYWYEDKAIF